MKITASCHRPLAEVMEDRILHSADVLPLGPTESSGHGLAQTTLQTTAPDVAVQRHEIVFVDATVPDVATLVADLQSQQSAGRPIEIVTINADQDGLAVISAALADRHDITAVHLIAHGHEASLQIGNVTLNGETLLRRAGEVSAWGNAFSADADLLIYGCDLAAAADGLKLVNDLSALTGADVAASTDLTGAAALGGDWVLEVQTGQIEAAGALSVQAQQQWQGVLFVYDVTNTTDGAFGSLRWAIDQANANAGDDTIKLGAGTYLVQLAGAGDDNNQSDDFDIKGDLTILGSGAGSTVVSGNGNYAVLKSSAAVSTYRV